MKKILLSILFLSLMQSASAEMKIIPNSFRDFAGRNVEAGENGLGHMNMTSQSIEWGTDENGEPAQSTQSCIYISFQNMAPEDLDKIHVSVEHPSMVSRKSTKLINGLPTLQVMFGSGDNLRLTLQHPNDNIGKLRLEPYNYKAGHVYGVDILNAGVVNVPITSEPSGATVYFDGENAGQTPLTITNVKMGPHNISLVPGDPKVAEEIGDNVIYITSANRAFNYPMYKTKTFRITPVPSSAQVTVTHNGTIVAEGTGQVTIKDARYDNTYDILGVAGADKMLTKLQINDLTPDNYKFKIIGTKNITFVAKQNNATVGAELVIDGKLVGTTPVTQLLDYNTYKISASYGGYAKEKEIKVKKSSSSDVVIKIPNKKSVGFNPFDVDYHKRQWGISAAYVDRYFTAKKNGKMTKFDWIGEPGSSTAFNVGITYQPYFGYGQGLYTGVYYMGTMGKTEFISPETGETTDVKYNESSLFVPLQYQFRLPLAREFSVAVNVGVGMTYGCGNTYKYNFRKVNDPNSWTGESTEYDKYDVGYGYNQREGKYFPEKFDYSFLLGASLQFYCLQIELKYSAGLKNHKISEFIDEAGDPNPTSYKSGYLSGGISFLF